MHAIETITRLNSQRDLHPLYWHPRIAALRQSIGSLSVADNYRTRLRSSLYKYADQFIARPYYKPNEGWDDLEALQQVTLGDLMEESLRRMCDQYREVE